MGGGSKIIAACGWLWMITRFSNACLKLFNVSDIEESGNLRVLYEVPIDLQNIKDLHGDFTPYCIDKCSMFNVNHKKTLSY